jgi:competence protein ComEC
MPSASTAIVFALLAVLIWHPFPPQVERGVLEITAIDVGQGDSILIAFPDGKLMLMDGGGIPAFGRQVKSRLDIGEDVVSPYLWSRSIRRLDVIALSHAHEDHIGGLGAVFENFHVKELWTGATPDSPAWDALRDKALRAGAKIEPMRRGAPFPFGGVTVQTLAPGVDYTPSSSPNNNDSLALRLTYGRRSVLLTGDIERRVEAELLSENLVERADVLKVPHHGSKTSSRKAFVSAVQATDYVVSSGPTPYGPVVLPDQEVLTLVQAMPKAHLWRTDENDPACKTSTTKIGPPDDGKPGGCNTVHIHIPGSATSYQVSVF